MILFQHDINSTLKSLLVQPPLWRVPRPFWLICIPEKALLLLHPITWYDVF
jgi:hypothetical protein